MLQQNIYFPSYTALRTGLNVTILSELQSSCSYKNRDKHFSIDDMDIRQAELEKYVVL